MARDQARAQRDAYKLQKLAIQAQQAAYRRQIRGIRRRSLLGPLLVIAIGVVLLLVRNGNISTTEFLDDYTHWWPMVFVFAGVVVLAEWAFDQIMLSQNPDAPPVGRRGVGAGVVLLLILLSIFGAVNMAVRHHSHEWISALGGEGELVGMEHLLGDKHESDQTLEQSFPAGTALAIDNISGDVTVNGGSSDGKIHIAVHKEVYSLSDSDAEKHERDISPQISTSGGLMAITVPGFNGTSAFLTVSLPETASTTVTVGRGDIQVTGIKAPVNVTANHGDVELSEIGGDVTVRINRNDASFSAHNITGSVALKGHAQDLSLSDIGGQVGLEGDFYGSTHLEQIRGGLRFHTSRTDLQVARLDGEVEISSDASLSVDRAAGPTLLTTKDRNITFDRMTGDVSVTNTNGTVDLTAAPPLGDVTVKNRGGSVNLTLPDHVGFSVQADTTDGSVENEFDLQSVDHEHRASMSGTVGRGGPKVQITASHGDIDLRKAVIAPLTAAPVAPEAPVAPAAPASPRKRAPKPPAAPKAPGEVVF
jgi:DUF4097 and DUF4098 domain-containing protein YvlB